MGFIKEHYGDVVLAGIMAVMYPAMATMLGLGVGALSLPNNETPQGEKVALAKKQLYSTKIDGLIAREKALREQEDALVQELVSGRVDQDKTKDFAQKRLLFSADLQNVSYDIIFDRALVETDARDLSRQIAIALKYPLAEKITKTDLSYLHECRSSLPVEATAEEAIAPLLSCTAQKTDEHIMGAIVTGGAAGGLGLFFGVPAFSVLRRKFNDSKSKDRKGHAAPPMTVVEEPKKQPEAPKEQRMTRQLKL